MGRSPLVRASLVRVGSARPRFGLDRESDRPAVPEPALDMEREVRPDGVLPEDERPDAGRSKLVLPADERRPLDWERAPLVVVMSVEKLAATAGATGAWLAARCLRGAS